MRNTNSIKSALITLISLSLFTACGSNGITGENETNNQPLNDGGNAPIINDGSGFLAMPFSYSLTGYTAQTVTPNILTDNLLRVKVRSEIASRNGNTSVPTNFTAAYKCAIYRVTMEVAYAAPASTTTTSGRAAVNNNLTWVTLPSKVTQPLTVPGTTGCTGSIADETFDFSGYLNAGHSYVRVKVEALKTDFTCNLPQYAYCTTYLNQYGAYPNVQCQAACPYMAPMNTHTVNGSLELQVNGSDFN